MLFNSLFFLIYFLPLVLLGNRIFRGQALLRWITLSSFAFYAFAGEPWFLIPMLVTTVLDFFLALKIESTKSAFCRRLWLGLSLCGNLGLLVYFKYSGLIVRTLSKIMFYRAGGDATAPWIDLFSVILPAGISFYTFQTLSYIIDVYKGAAPAETNFFEFAAFVSFFPHLVAGPLTRHQQLIPQLQRLGREGANPRWEAGVLLFAVGLCKKTLLADRIGNLIDPHLNVFSAMGPALSWLLIFGYSLQIYFDFSGYSDMAIGLGRLFGIELPQNFNSPYQALNPSDFWRRWHMTLSQWLRDYLYFPLGGSRRGKIRNLINLLVTMFLGGLWHGAMWAYAIWGIYHGTLLVVYHLVRPVWDRLHDVIQRGLTFLLVCLGWVLFRAQSMHNAKRWLAGAFNFRGDWSLNGWTSQEGYLAVLLLAGFAIVFFAPNASASQELSHLSRPKQFILGVMSVFAVLCMNYSSKFLYFQF